MNYTENYHLPQWEETDRIMRVDFNDAMANLEEGMTNAQTAADKAQKTADAAAILPYAIGTYTGAGVNQEINVGFRPRLVIISGFKDSPAVINIEDFACFNICVFGNCWVLNTGNYLRTRLHLNLSGFIAIAQHYYAFPNLTQSERVYDYIAFK